jgi:transposase, IS30 family
MTIASMSQGGSRLRAMARSLARLPGTVIRELARNSCAQHGYASVPARTLSQARRVQAHPAAKLDPQHVLWGTVLSLLDWKWSPSRPPVSSDACGPRTPACTSPTRRLHGHLRAAAWRVAPPGHRLPAPRSQHAHATQAWRRSAQADPRDGEHPCASAQGRGPRHAGPLGVVTSILGAGNKASVGVLVERTNRLMVLAKMDDATAASALAGFSAKLNSIATPLRHSLTYDQGKEMTRHRDLSANADVKVYLCDPHSPWQRGTCESTNGLLRQYLPKGTGLSVHTQDELDAIADSLNNRPRTTHTFHSPLEVFGRTLKAVHQPSTSIH